MPPKHTITQVLNNHNINNCDPDPATDLLTPSPKTPIQEDYTDTSAKRSFVWRYFKTIVVDGVPVNVCQVNKTAGGAELCLEPISVCRKRSTTSMLNHLARKHQLYDEKSGTGAITKLLHKGDSFRTLDRDSLTAAVARFFVTCNIPFNTVGDENFHQLLRICNPSVDSIICSKDTVSSYIRKSFQQGKRVLRNQLCNLKSNISITCDTWTSPSNLSVLGVTAHWIDDDFSLQSITLGARLITGSHTGVCLAEHLLEVLEDFNICDRFFCITSDNASNNRTMGAHLAQLISFDNKHCLLGCMAHVINLAAQAGIKTFSSVPHPSTQPTGNLASILNEEPPDVEVKTIISRISGLVSLLKHSPMKAAEFQSLTSGMRKKELTLIQDVSTRWNSTFSMLQRASELKRCIEIFCQTHNITDKYGLDPHEWYKLDQLCNFLAPLDDATKTITPEHTTSLMVAAPVYMLLMKELEDASHKYDAQEMIPSAIEMLAKLRGYFDAAIKKPVYLCSTILDPRLKMEVFDRPGFLEMIKLDKHQICEIFKIEAQKFKSDQYNKDVTNDEPDPKARRTTLTSTLFSKKRRKIGSLDDEIDYYLDSDTEEASYRPLDYWKSKSEQFPSLASMARTYLAVPASSAPSERAFSAGRHIQDYTRNRLCIDTLEALLCLKDWVDEGVIDVGHINSATS